MPILLTNPIEQIAAEATIKAAKSEAPSHQNVYFLGPYARRVGFASQQNRALNLIWALTRMGHINPGQKIAVVGAGLSGVTTAVALKQEKYDVTLIERRDQVLHRQYYSSHRFIHPTINQWPDTKDCPPTTLLPYFDWMGDICSRVVEALTIEWKQLAGKYEIVPCCNSEIIGIEKRDQGTLLAFRKKGVGQAPSPKAPEKSSDEIDKNHPLALTYFDAVIVTSGFGDEPVMNLDFLQTYWRNDNLETFLADENQRFVVSGCGDGGLIDTLRIAHKDFRFGEFVMEVVSALQHHADWPHAENIKLAEQAASSNAAAREAYINKGSKALRDVYDKAALELPDDVAQMLDTSLRNKLDLVQLVCPQEWPYSPLAAPIHKLLLAHAMRKDRVKHVPGWVKEPIEEKRVWVSTPGKEELVPIEGKVVIRHGARPNFENILNDNAEFERLRNEQLSSAENLDKRLWASGEHPLFVWPPPLVGGKVNKELLKDRWRRTKPLWTKLTDLGLKLRPDDEIGFKVEPDTDLIEAHKSPEEQRAQEKMLADLPSELFGIKLQPVPTAAFPENSTAQSATTIVRSPASYTTLFPGMPITVLRTRPSRDPASSGEQTLPVAEGRLGPFVRDAGGRRFALTVGHLLPLIDAGETMSIEAGGCIIDVPRYTPLPNQPYFPESASLSQFEIGAGLPATNAYGPNGHIDHIAQQDSIFGEKVFIYLPDQEARSGYVSSPATTVTFRNPNTGRDDVFTGVVRIRSLGKDKFSDRGDSGAPVVSESGALIGLVLSGKDNLSYVAPVWRYFEQNKLKLDTESPISWSNAVGSTASRRETRDLLRELGRMTRRAALEFETDPFDRSRPVPADDEW